MEKLQAKLLEAATQNSITSLQSLLKDDPLLLDRAVVNRFNETPLHVAAMLGHLALVQELLRLRPQLVNELNSQLSSPLHLAAAGGHVGVVRALLSVDTRACLQRDRDELLPLHLAAARGRVEAMRLLLEAEPGAARLAACGGETVLHLCVKRWQLEAMRVIVERVRDAEFMNSRDGNTILHLAVAEKQVETIKFLVSMGSVEVNALNDEGITALDVLIRSRRDVRDPQIEKPLKNGGGSSSSSSTPAHSKSWEGLMKQHDSWVERKKSALMVVASLTAAMAFQIGVNPPGGVWQDDYTVDSQGKDVSDPHVAGESIFLTKYPEGYVNFYVINTIAFVASLSIVLLLMSGLPLRRRFFMWILMAITWIAITAIALSYAAVITMLTPPTGLAEDGSLLYAIGYTVIAWVILMAFLLIGHTIRMIVKLVRKVRKAWVLRRKRFASSVGPIGP